ncbi:MAG: hypothetical protein ABI823_00170 [Bryobacteraceae bacterium]
MKLPNPILTLSLLVTLLPMAAWSQHPKPKIDPESHEGLLLQQILQESNQPAKLRLLEQFSVQYPKHEAIGWVNDQLLPGYFKAQDFDGTLAVCERALPADPTNLDFGQICLRGAEGKKKPELIDRYANTLWTMAAAQADGATPAAVHARQLQTYAEYHLYVIASQTADSKKRLELLQALEKRNPKGRYIPNIQADYVQIYKSMTGPAALPFAEKLLARDPNNVDILVAVAEQHFRKEDNPDLVANYCGRTLDILGKPRPDYIVEEEWTKRISQYSNMCNWMAGISSSVLRRYAQADRYLRAALPYAKDNTQMLAAAFYHLGFANYRIAETSGERSRIPDALTFLKQCAAIRSSFQEQATKNVASIKAEYNLQ